jgi:transcriptional regulator with XRE-family HTH domain
MPQRSLRKAPKIANRHRPKPAKRSRPVLHLVTEDEAAQVFVPKPKRGRPRKLDVERAKENPGAELKRIRRRNKISLAEVERETRVHERYLEALESNAPVESFPGAAYARAFLREYATFLRVDQEPLLAAHPATRPDPAPKALSELLPPPERPASTTNPWAWTVLAAGLLISVLIWSVSRGAEPEHTASKPDPLPSVGLGGLSGLEPGLNAGGPVADDPAPAAIEQIAVQIVAANGPCWIRATGDGKTLFERTLHTGATQVFDAKHALEVTLGNARAVTMTINGEPYDLRGAQVIKLTIAIVDGRLKITAAPRGTKSGGVQAQPAG